MKYLVCFSALLSLTLGSVAQSAEPQVGAGRTLLPHSRQQPGLWRYTFEQPDDDWTGVDFDDDSWLQGRGGFGTEGTPNAEVNTVWNSERIWLRRTFDVQRPIEGELYFLLHHDEDTTVYLDGVRAAQATWYNTDFDMIPLEPVGAAVLRGEPGKAAAKITIAVECRQTYGGQYIDVGLVAVKENRWSRQKAQAWYDEQPWPCGFNYVPANAISYTEMWMDYNFDAKLIDRELALAEKVGFNCLRVILPFVVWEHDPKAFKERLDTFLDICERRGLRVMIELFDDCAFGAITDPKCERQPEVLVGWYANGWTPSPGHSIVRDAEQWPRLERYVTDIIGSYKNDSRVWVWDLYNEPTNGGLGDVSIALVENTFRWARAVDPDQPLTVGQWHGNAALNAVIFSNSDIITFHNYSDAANLTAHIKGLQVHGRPIINTEWLNRGHGSFVSTCLPVFREENVGCMHWGLVNGKTQTHLNWGHRPGQPDPAVWQHDLFDGQYQPWYPEEIELFRQTINP